MSLFRPIPIILTRVLNIYLQNLLLYIESIELQYRHLIPAPVDLMFANALLYKQPWMICQENKPSTSKAHVTFESKLRSVVGHTCIHAKGNCVAIGRVVVYTARAAHISSPGIKCRHCRRPYSTTKWTPRSPLDILRTLHYWAPSFFPRSPSVTVTSQLHDEYYLDCFSTPQYCHNNTGGRSWWLWRRECIYLLLLLLLWNCCWRYSCMR